jgi:hypothetical protein
MVTPEVVVVMSIASLKLRVGDTRFSIPDRLAECGGRGI